MISPSYRIWDLSGRPHTEAEGIPSVCWVCGSTCSRSVDRLSWMGANFVGQNRVRAPNSDRVCEPCVFVMAGRPPDTLRMYSHLYDDRGWMKLNKGDKPRMREWLRGPKRGEWFAAIADSGQKHLIPWTPVNPPGAFGRVLRVLFEERVVALEDWRLVDCMTRLLTMGVTKEEISSGDYGPRAWQMARDDVRLFENAYRSVRGGGWFDLAVWLAQRDEATVQDRLAKEKANAERKRQGAATKRDGGRSARSAGRVPADAVEQRPEALDAAPGSAPCSVPDDEQCGGVGDGHDANVAPGRPQLDLFGGGARPG